MTSDPESADPWSRGMMCLRLAISFDEDLVRLGLAAAVARLREGLAYNDLTLDTDERLFARVMAGEIFGADLAEAICSPRRMELPGARTVH